MASLPAIQAAVVAKNISELKTLLKDWSAPVFDLQPALNKAIETQSLEAVTALMSKGCVANSGEF
jgi:hypothetical protein